MLQNLLEKFQTQDGEIVKLSNQISDISKRINSKTSYYHAKKLEEENLKSNMQEKQMEFKSLAETEKRTKLEIINEKNIKNKIYFSVCNGEEKVNELNEVLQQLTRSYVNEKLELTKAYILKRNMFRARVYSGHDLADEYKSKRAIEDNASSDCHMEDSMNVVETDPNQCSRSCELTMTEAVEADDSK